MDKKNLQNTQNLELLLEKLNREFSDQLINSGKIEMDEARILNRLHTLFSSMKQDSSGEKHYTLSELRKMVRERKELGEDWDLPDHLTCCSSCLEAFQILLEGIPEIDTQTFHCVVDDKITRHYPTAIGSVTSRSLSREVGRKRRRTLVFMLVLIAILVVGITAIVLSPTIPLVIDAGTVQIGQRECSNGFLKVRPAVPVVSGTQPVQMTVAGVYLLKIAPGVRFSFDRASVFSEWIRICELDGRIEMQTMTSTPGLQLAFEYPFATVIPQDADLSIECRKMPELLTPIEGPESSRDTTPAGVTESGSVNCIRLEVRRGSALVNIGGEETGIAAGEDAFISQDGVRKQKRSAR